MFPYVKKHLLDMDYLIATVSKQKQSVRNDSSFHFLYAFIQI